MTRSSRPTTPRLAAACAAALLLAACGGGGGGALAPTPSAPVTSASLSGQVVEIDGETTALGGVAITLAETGKTAITASDGTFDLGTVPTGSLSLSVAQPTSASTFVVFASGPGSAGDGSSDDMPGMDDNGSHGMDDMPGMDDSGHHESEVEDGEDLDDDGMHVHRAENQEQIRVRVRIRDGEISEMQVSRSGHAEREVEMRMTRTQANGDPDMEGKVELESRDDRERFKVRAEHADPDLELDCVVVDPDGNEESIGTRTVGLDGEARWTLDTSLGARLPFGVASVEDLQGYRVEVRRFADGVALLTTDVNELPTAVEDDDGSDDGSGGGSGSDGEMRMRSRVMLQAHEAGVEGYCELRSRPEDGEERFDMEAEHLGSGRRVAFEIETGEGTGVYNQLRTMTANADGEAELEINTRDGGVLPNGASEVAELVRLRVQVRDADTDAIILSGTVPTLVLDE